MHATYDLGLCITDVVANDSPEKQEQRFKMFRDIGIRSVRMELEWEAVEPQKGIIVKPQKLSHFHTAVRYGMRLKLIGGTIMNPPNWFFEEHPEAYMLDHNGKRSLHNGISYWMPTVTEYTANALENTFRILQEEKLLEAVDALIVDMGTAGEPLYPSGWTQVANGLDEGGCEDTMWCYAANAQRDFQIKMQGKYGCIAAANAAWGTQYTDFSALTVPKPNGSVKGALWADTLYWYRDVKRAFEEAQLQEYKRIADRYSDGRIRLVLYLPGWDVRDEQYEEAIAAGTACPMIRLMADNRFILYLAQKYDCLLQHTGVNDDWEAEHIRLCCDQLGMSDVPIFGENAGDYNNAKDPERLVEIIYQNRYAGIDYTHSRHLFLSDGVTPSPLFVPFAKALQNLQVYLQEQHNE